VHGLDVRPYHRVDVALSKREKQRIGEMLRKGRQSARVNRKSPEFADFLLEIAATYPRADTIHLVMDNLSTHTRKRCWNGSERRLEAGCGRGSPSTTRPNMEAG